VRTAGSRCWSRAPSFRLSEMLPGGSFEQGEAPWRLVEIAQPRPGLGCEKGLFNARCARSELLLRQRHQQRGRLAPSTRDSPDRIGKSLKRQNHQPKRGRYGQPAGDDCPSPQSRSLGPPRHGP
jgi:hypothetical protein